MVTSWILAWYVSCVAVDFVQPFVNLSDSDFTALTKLWGRPFTVTNTITILPVEMKTKVKAVLTLSRLSMYVHSSSILHMCKYVVISTVISSK